MYLWKSMVDEACIDNSVKPKVEDSNEVQIDEAMSTSSSIPEESSKHVQNFTNSTLPNVNN